MDSSNRLMHAHSHDASMEDFAHSAVRLLIYSESCQTGKSISTMIGLLYFLPSLHL